MTTAIIPDRPNIHLRFVEKHPQEMQDTLEWYLQELAANQFECSKAIIYCRNLRQTGRGYGMMAYSLFKQSGLAKPVVRKLVAEYHAELYESDRQRIAAEFRKPDSHIRCLVSTVAFGMGIDIPDIRYIIHWGESNSITQYWQEVGRGGRDGSPAEAILYHSGTHLHRCEEATKELFGKVKLGFCIRNLVLSSFRIPEMASENSDNRDKCVANCCSVCADKCACTQCSHGTLIVATASIDLGH